MLTAGTAAHTVACGYVLHVVPANGGGVDRYVRDICARRSRDCILHVVQEQCVFEAVTAHRFVPVDRERTSDPGFVAALGRPALLHAHSTLAPVREQVALLSKALGVDWVLTLHDVDFVGAFGAVEADECEARLDFVRNAAQRIVPSAFISGLLSSALGTTTMRQLIENGVDVAVNGSDPAAMRDVTGAFQVAVVGALGAHKGLNFLQAVAAALPAEIRVVIIGYADGQITPGWLQEDRLWVHGPFQPSELAGLIRGYGVQIALFPNRQPESYSYALSDVWLAGIPALGPGSGALGERIVQTGAGWTYDANDAAEIVAAMVHACLGETERVASSVYLARGGLLPIANMVKRLDGVYETTMSTHQTSRADVDSEARIDALEAIAAANLNGHFFRRELTKLGGDLAFSQSQVANAEEALKSVQQEYDSRGVWIDTLERSLAEFKAEIARLEAARIVEHTQSEVARLNERTEAEVARANEHMLAEAARHEQRRLLETAYETALADQRAAAEAARIAAHAAHEQHAAKLQQDVTDTLAIAHEQQRRIAIYDQALWMIPSWIQKKILARAERIVSKKASQ